MFKRINSDEIEIDLTGREIFARGRESGIDEYRVGLLYRLRQHVPIFDVEKLTVMVEVLFTP